MGLIGRIIQSFIISKNRTSVRDIKIGFGGGNNVTCEQYTNAGIDSAPLPGDTAVALNIDKKGRMVVIGHSDGRFPHEAKKGEIRIYGRDANGYPVGSIFFKSDGSISIKNENASVILKPAGGLNIKNKNGDITMGLGGEVTINGVVISKEGNVKIPGDLILGPHRVNDHKHMQSPDSAGDIQSVTSPML